MCRCISAVPAAALHQAGLCVYDRFQVDREKRALLVLHVPYSLDSGHDVVSMTLWCVSIKLDGVIIVLEMSRVRQFRRNLFDKFSSQ